MQRGIPIFRKYPNLIFVINTTEIYDESKFFPVTLRTLLLTPPLSRKYNLLFKL